MIGNTHRKTTDLMRRNSNEQHGKMVKTSYYRFAV